MPSIHFFACLAVLAVTSVSCSTEPESVANLNTRTVTLPGGQKIQAEVMLLEMDMMRGMMFRDSLAPDRGMLFVHPQAGNYNYWMYQVKIPLDIIWMDTDHRIVEISPNTPPCTTNASDCAHYGGKAKSQFVLELAGGMAAKYGLKVGDAVRF